MRRVLLILAVLIATPVVLFALGSLVYGQPGVVEKLFGPVRREPVDFGTLQLKPAPNQYLVCPEGYCAAQAHAVSPVFPESPDELRTRWEELMAATPRVTLLGSSDDGWQQTYQALTPLIGWPDTVTVRFVPREDGGSTLAIYSRSHYGYGDLGVNKKRVEAWLAALQK